MIQAHKSAPRVAIIRTRYKLCPSCGNFSHIQENQSYCILCGAKLMEECPSCSEPIIYPTAKFCPACGQPLVIGKQVQNEEQSEIES